MINQICSLFTSYKDDPSTPSWRHVQTGGHDHLKWWNKNFHREATINIAPAATGNI
jgi:hypothetical protein